MIRLLPLLMVTACGGGDDPEKTPSETACNGYDELCDRTVDDITWARAHNAHATDERGYHLTARNHLAAIPTQLESGIRSLNVHVWDYLEDPEFPEITLWACHTYCSLGRQPMDEVLVEVEDFLAANEREVILLDFGMATEHERIREPLENSGLASRAYVYIAGETWPTLGEMIDAEQRLMIIGGDAPDMPDWYLNKETFWYGTPWGAKQPEDFDCGLKDGIFLEGGLFELENSLTDPISLIELAELVNYEEQLLPRAEECGAEVGKNPNLLSVDFWDVGDVVLVADKLNGVR